MRVSQSGATLEATSFTSLALYLQFLGMDKILELGLHDIVCRYFVKTYFMLVNRPEQLLNLCPRYLGQCSQHSLWESSLCVKAFYQLLDTYSWWTPGAKVTANAKELLYTNKEIYGKADFLLRSIRHPLILDETVTVCPLLLICLVKWPTLSALKSSIRSFLCSSSLYYRAIKYGPKPPKLYVDVLLRGATPVELMNTIYYIFTPHINRRVEELLVYLRLL